MNTELLKIIIDKLVEVKKKELTKTEKVPC